MTRISRPVTEHVFALMRWVVGLNFALHGAQKLFGAFGAEHPVALTSLMGLAGIIEFFGGLLVAFGIFTSVAAFIASGEMAVAFFMAHFPRGWIPLLNHGELAVVYCFVFLYVAAHGGGRWTVPALLRWSRRKHL